MNPTIRRQLAARKRRIARRIENQPGVEGRPADDGPPPTSTTRSPIAPGPSLPAGHRGRSTSWPARSASSKTSTGASTCSSGTCPITRVTTSSTSPTTCWPAAGRIEHLEVRRNDEVYLDALGARRIPDPTTAGDFCRRFAEADVERLMDTVNEARLRVWKEQPDSFFDEAFIDADGTLAPTDGWCKQGVDISYNGVWGLPPAGRLSRQHLPSRCTWPTGAATAPSHEHADGYLDRAIELCRRGGFRKITLRGDTDFTQTRHLDRWDEDGVRFVFGIDAMANLKGRAEDLPADSYGILERPARSTIKSHAPWRP